MMNALRDGWLLEENEETWQEIPCLRLSMDQSGDAGGKDCLHGVAVSGSGDPGTGEKLPWMVKRF